jgi:GNAT superfamily N-acetyltransferase
MSHATKTKLPFTIRPLTPELWPALEELFGEKGACKDCWCMYWRIGAAYRKQPPEANKQAFRQIVRNGPPPGLLAFDGDLAVGWCQLTPRNALPWLDRNWRLKRVDDLPVWSISCLYVRIGYRRRGVTSALIAAAVESAKRAKAPRSKHIRSMPRRVRAQRAPAIPRLSNGLDLKLSLPTFSLVRLCVTT